MISPLAFFALVAAYLLVSRRVSALDGVCLLLCGMLLAGTTLADDIAYPLAWTFSRL